MARLLRTTARSLLIAAAAWGLSAGIATANARAEPAKVATTPAEIVSPVQLAAARQELAQALASNSAASRAHAVEALRQGLGERAAEEIIKALDDTSPMVRFAAAMAAGELRLTQAAGTLLRVTNDANASVRAAAVFGLHRLGDTRFSRSLEQLLLDPSPDVRGNTCIALGRLGEKSAIKILLPLLKDTEPSVRLQAGEALWLLGDERGMRLLVASTLSADIHSQMFAMTALAAARDTRVVGHVKPFLKAAEPELALMAARGLGMLGDGDGYKLASAGTQSKAPRHRMLAALALGAINRPEAAPTLAGLLKDTDADVRIAAATALLQLH